MGTQTDKILETAISTGAAEPAILLLSKVTAINLNTTADQKITLFGGNTFIISDIVITNASQLPTTAADGEWWSGVNRTGIQYYATNEGNTPFEQLANPSNFINTSSQYKLGERNAIQNIYNLAVALGGVNTISSNILYFSLGTAEGQPLLCDMYIYGTILN
jgi:hypothetical protein